MQEFQYIIKDPLGIHARPAGLLVKEVSKYDCKVEILKQEKMVDASKIMGIMSLCIKQGNEITFRVTGEFEKETAEQLHQFLIHTL